MTTIKNLTITSGGTGLVLGASKTIVGGSVEIDACPKCGSSRVTVHELTMDAGEIQSADIECDVCGHRDTRVYRNARQAFLPDGREE